MRLKRRKDATRLVVDEELRAKLLSTVGQGRTATTVFEALRCTHCGGVHVRTCPRVKSMRFDRSTGRLLAVEFFASGEWDDRFVIFPEQVYAEPLLAPAADTDER